MYFTWFNIQPFCFVNQIDSHHWQMALWLIGCACFQIIWRWGSESEFLRAPDCHALVSFIHALVSFQRREFPHLKIIEQKPPKMINTRLKALSWVVLLYLTNCLLMILCSSNTSKMLSLRIYNFDFPGVSFTSLFVESQLFTFDFGKIGKLPAK